MNDFNPAAASGPTFDALMFQRCVFGVNSRFLLCSDVGRSLLSHRQGSGKTPRRPSEDPGSHPPVSAGAPPLCDGDLPGRGVYPGPRGTSGEPGSVHGDAGPGGGAHHGVRQRGVKRPGISANTSTWPFICAFFRAPLTSDEQGRKHTHTHTLYLSILVRTF